MKYEKLIIEKKSIQQTTVHLNHAMSCLSVCLFRLYKHTNHSLRVIQPVQSRMSFFHFTQKTGDDLKRGFEGCYSSRDPSGAQCDPGLASAVAAMTMGNLLNPSSTKPMLQICGHTPGCGLWVGKGPSNMYEKNGFVHIPSGVKNILPNQTACLFPPVVVERPTALAHIFCANFAVLFPRDLSVSVYPVVNPSCSSHGFKIVPPHTTNELPVGSILLLFADELKKGASCPPLSMAMTVLPANMLSTSGDAWRWHAAMSHLHNNLLEMQSSFNHMVVCDNIRAGPVIMHKAPAGMPDELIRFYNSRLISEACVATLRGVQPSSSAAGAVSISSSSAGGGRGGAAANRPNPASSSAGGGRGGAAASSDVVIVKVEPRKRGADGDGSAQAKKAKE